MAHQQQLTDRTWDKPMAAARAIAGTRPGPQRAWAVSQWASTTKKRIIGGPNGDSGRR